MEGVGIEKIVKKLQLKKYIEDMELKGHRIRLADVNRPALQLSGYFEHFEQSRVQIYHVLFSAGIYSRMTCSYRGQRKIMCRYSEQAEAHQNSWRS